MPPPSVLTIGNFDGLHRGHQAILRRCRAIAEHHSARVVALPFDPHPMSTLRPGAEPPRLTTREEKAASLKAWGADEVDVLEPTKDTLGQSPEQFVNWLVAMYRPVAIVEGADFRFGQARAGDMQRLAELGEAHGFEAVIESAVEIGLSDMLIAPVSSSLVRWLVGRGRVRDAALCLADSFTMTGPVAPGEQQGRRIGVPTLNLDPAAYLDHMVPADGVYAGAVTLDTGEQYPAAVSVGVKPTFGEHRLTVEAHLLDFDDRRGDGVALTSEARGTCQRAASPTTNPDKAPEPALSVPPGAREMYGRTVTFHFARWLRDQYPYPDLEPLKAQLHRDIAHTRRWYEAGLLDTPTPRYASTG